MLNWFKKRWNFTQGENDNGRDTGALTDSLTIENLFITASEHATHGDIDSAEKYCKEILKIERWHPETHQLLAEIESAQGNYQAAIHHLEAAVHHHREPAEIYFRLGSYYQKIGQFDEALDCYRISTHYGPDRGQAFLEMGNLYKQNGEIDQAIQCYKKTIELDPSSAAAYALLGSLYHTHRQLDEALFNYREAVRLKPDFADVWNNIGNVLLATEQYRQALEPLKTAATLQPNSSKTRLNLGCAYRHLGEFESAHDEFEFVLRKEPNHFDATWFRSHLWLASEEWEKGWSAYEARFHAEGVLTFRALPYAPWKGEEPLDGKTLLVFGEQGLGDEIMFASCLPDILAQAGHCIVDCNRRLLPLFRRSFPAATVVGSDHEFTPSWLRDAPPIDYQIPIGSLPLHFRNKSSDFPSHKGYLRADPQLVRNWQQKLAELGDGLKVGISWKGGTSQTGIKNRSIPLSALIPILGKTRAKFICLQYGDCQSEIEQIEREFGIKIHYWREAIDDYDQTASLVYTLDLVITVCTAIVHLTGALGKPAWVLTPAVSEWRYLRTGETLPWYPSVKLFRQRKAGDWTSVINEVADSLDKFRVMLESCG
ncbi:tetratricopeptide repeat-containing glycosyltransferase family protein [Methylocaldum sp.]|uniref:tetratricopeptide repeat-containing glycosyltransferase family protein n=1 Tax=Methylocaldum sp. TaxID=1969727 RepID=UPI002D6287FE|nr:tetratricopeptide repeat-containing glycosyltransferase family protein [Methylocaldum sp.]HYE36634.1 tetratricopeptide repeat-containing glycosyltransferase family protein [Methylocaldum sp.]